MSAGYMLSWKAAMLSRLPALLPNAGTGNDDRLNSKSH
jgi:hypothetical protein